jgi:PKD repeat protein
MSRWTIALVLALALAFSLQAAEWVPLTSSTPHPPQVTVLSDTPGETVFRVDVPGYFLDEVSVNGVLHARMLLAKSPRLLRAGEPELPFVAVSIAIPREGIPVAELIESELRTVPIGHYLPSKGSLSRSVDPGTVPFTFSQTYVQDASYPPRGCEAGEPYLLRNLRGTAVAVYPFRYNPVHRELSVAASMTVRVRTSQEGGANVLNNPVPDCREFQEVYSEHFANGGAAGWAYTPVNEAGHLLIITNDTFYDALLPLVAWKRQKGIPTEIAKLSVVGNTSALVKTFIQNRYNQGSLAYVLLVGDSAFMPYPIGTAGNVVGNAADPMYALLAGSDSYPEIVVSRFPAQTVTEASTMVNRVIRYEKTPQTSATWYNTAVGIASAEGSPTDGQRMDWLRTDLLGYGYATVDQIYDPGATASQVSAALNSGRGLINYIGHGGETYWVTTGFGVSHVYALTNTDLVPFIFDVACVNGMFNRSGGDCFAEAWLKAGTPAAPKGALGIYAASTNQDWVPPCNAQGESVDLLVQDRYHTFGALCFNGVMKGLDMYPGTEGMQLFQQWHVFGDGSQMVFTDTPMPLTVTHATGLPAGAMSFDVSVPGVQGALCALYDEASRTLYGSAYTGAGGAATIPLDPAPAGIQSLTLTVTAFNRIPYTAAVPVGGDYIQASASASVTGGMWPLPVTFTATVTGGTTPYTYLWTFGDGTSSTQKNPIHTYMTAGVFPVVLTARDAAGFTSKDAHLAVTVTAPPCTVTCAATVPTTGSAGSSVEFGASSSGSTGCTGNIAYSWAFGDGESSAQKNPRHTYATAGTYAWSLTVSMLGQTCSKTGTIAVAPVCAVTCQGFAVPASGDAPLSVSFSGSATATACAGAPAFAWSFGDGTSSNLQNPTHTYDTAGNYTWVLTATADGKTCSKTGAITVGEPCTLACTATVPPAGRAGDAVAFQATAEANHCTGSETYAWTFGDGGISSEPTPGHVYTSGGTFTWTLTTAVENQTCTKTGSVVIREACAVTCAADAAPSSGVAPLAMAFSASVTSPYCDGSPTFSWSFGDGGVSTDQNPSHTFASPGSYAWTLTVEVEGKTCAQAGTVTVAAPCALTCEATGPQTGKVGTPAPFSATASASNCAGNPTFVWAFGDGQTSAEPNPSHVYETAGDHAWTLVVTAGGLSCTRAGVVAVAPSIPGDADGDGVVSIGEVQQAVNMFLEVIPPGNGVDCDGDGAVSIGELQKVLNAFLGLASSCQ